MPKTISMEIPQKWLEGIPDKPAIIREIIALGIKQYKMDQALKLYKNGGGSIGYVAELFHLSKRDLIQAARKSGIEPDFTEETVHEELD
ncbi:hypothetical protein JXL19_10035 [bacterium]|nr:hypothetical protein [bacterium]